MRDQEIKYSKTEKAVSKNFNGNGFFGSGFLSNAKARLYVGRRPTPEDFVFGQPA